MYKYTIFMKSKIILALMFLLTWSIVITCHANTITRVAKDANHKFGVVEVRGNNYQPGQPTIIFLHGQGEIGSGSYSDLGKIANWGGVQYLYQATDLFDFNVVAVQTSSRYQYGEIQYAVDHAVNQCADPDRVYVIANSLGGYGFAQQSGVDPTLPGKLAAVAMIVMGPGEGVNTAVNIAASKTPVWFFSSADDLTSGTTVYKTDTLYNRIKRLGGNAWYTRYASGGHGIISRITGAYYKAPNNWKMAVCATGAPISATGFCSPPVSVYTWLLANKRGGVIVPSMMVVPLPMPMPKTIIWTIELYSDSTWRRIYQ